MLVSGRRKTRAPLTTTKLLKTIMGMDQWYVANMLSNGDSRIATLKAMEPKPTAVCLRVELNFNDIQCICRISMIIYFGLFYFVYLTEVGNNS